MASCAKSLLIGKHDISGSNGYYRVRRTWKAAHAFSHVEHAQYACLLAGITSLICGPGDLEQAHQPNEHIRRDAFERGAAMIHKVIERLCCAG